MPLLLRAVLSLWVGAMLGYAIRLASNMVPMGVLGEELGKLLGIMIVWQVVRQKGAMEGVAVGLGFGLTEAAFYMLTMWGDGKTIFLRLLLTTTMHATTGAVTAKWRWGIVGAIVIHLLFNYIVR